MIFTPRSRPALIVFPVVRRHTMSSNTIRILSSALNFLRVALRISVTKSRAMSAPLSSRPKPTIRTRQVRQDHSQSNLNVTACPPKNPYHNSHFPWR